MNPAGLTGAFYQVTAQTDNYTTQNSGTDSAAIAFDASRSSDKYGKSDTVTPSHVKYPWVIVVYNTAVSLSVAQAGEFVSFLDGKAGSNLENVTAEGRATAVRWAIPDYRAGVTGHTSLKTVQTLTAPSDGIIITGLCGYNGQGGTYVKVNETQIFFSEGQRTI